MLSGWIESLVSLYILPEQALVILKSVALDALLAAQDIELIGVDDENN